MRIKTTTKLYDLSGDDPGFIIPIGTILIVDSIEDDYWIVEYEEWAFPICFDEAEEI